MKMLRFINFNNNPGKANNLPFKPLHIMKKLFNILTEPFIQASSREKLFTILYTFAVLLICILASAI